MSTIPLFKVNMSASAGEAAAAVLASGYVGQGPRVDEFEQAFARAAGLAPEEHVLGMNSCSSAIELALHLIGVGPGDEVISTPITCTATNGPVVTRGAKLVWADVDPLTGNIDARSVARMRSEHTKAIIAVDWGGRSCNYSELRLAGSGKPRIPIIQDAAHCLAIPQEHGDYVAWSFGPIKHLTCGGYGGALLTPANQLERARLLRWHGLDRLSKADFRCDQDITEVGYRWHMTDDQAAVGRANIPSARRSVAQARDNARWYSQALSRVPGVTVPPFDPDSSYWLFTILVADRPTMISNLAAEGIASSPVHARNDRHTAFRAATARQDTLTGADYFDAHQLSIPAGWWLRDGDRERIASTIIRASACPIYPEVNYPAQEAIHA